MEIISAPDNVIDTLITFYIREPIMYAINDAVRVGILYSDFWLLQDVYML